MVELIFGLAFTIIPLIMAFAMYGGAGGEIYVNGVLTSQEEFNAMIWPKVLLGLFLLIGLSFLVAAFVKMIKNAKTSIAGVETYAIIIKEFPSNTTVNGCPIMNGEFAVVVDGQIRMFTESLGMDYKNGGVGDCVRVKQLGDDINIVAVTLFEEIPYDMQNILRTYHDNSYKNVNSPEFNTTEAIGEHVIINGMKYRKEN